MENKGKSRLVGMLGFAMRAGKVIIGTELVCKSMARRQSNGGARLILIASTASEATKNKIIHKSEFYGIRCEVCELDGEELGRILGKLYAPAVVALTDERFATEIERTIDGE